MSSNQVALVNKINDLVVIDVSASGIVCETMLKAEENYSEWASTFAKYPANTRRAYMADISDYKHFCMRFGYPMLTTDFALAKKTYLHYIEELIASELKRATIERRMCTLSALFKVTELPNPANASKAFSDNIKLTLRGKCKAQSQAKPLRIEDLEKINDTFIINSIKDLRDLMVINFLFSGLLRGAELAAVEHKNISVRDSTLFITKRKNDQDGKGGYCYLSDKCVELYERWKKDTGSCSGYVFRVVKRGDNVQENNIEYRTVYNVVRNVLVRCGMNPEGFSTHSGRVGSVVSMAEAGISNIDIQLSGGWSDPKMPARYAEQVNTKRTGIAKLMSSR